ncbi:prolipoprotein diacylglyceryl transferase [bacterium]|nr:prolipoprotein diacylglyceryl transferase [candidate division CSSED10-310 bacterium]
MHPDLFHIGPLTIHSYGTMIVIGFIAGLAIIRMRVKHYDIAFDKAVDLAFGLLLWGFVGAKLFYWLIIPVEFIDSFKLLSTDPVGWLKNLGNGFEFFGGIVAGVLFFRYFCKKHNLRSRSVLDLVTPAVPLAHAFGRIGCFLAGCCYGKTCSHSWAVVFTDPHSLAPRHSPLHPTQLYESFLLFVLTSVLLATEKKIARIPGRMISFYLVGYTLIRFIVEYFRADDRGFLPGLQLTGTQLIAIFVAAGAIVWLRVAGKPSKSSQVKARQ